MVITSISILSEPKPRLPPKTFVIMYGYIASAKPAPMIAAPT